jgi:hypothetical protein
MTETKFSNGAQRVRNAGKQLKRPPYESTATMHRVTNNVAWAQILLIPL